MGQRVIPVAVTAEYIGGDGVTLGAAGSHNSVLIEYDFRSAGPQWDDISGRYVLWTNPQGNNTNRINLGVNEKVAGYEGVYQAAPPADAMCVPGWAEMVVVGFTLDGDKEITKIKTEPSRFRVLPGPSRSADNEGIAPTVADQLQAEIEAVEARKVNKPVSPYDADGKAGQILESLGGGQTRWRDEVIVTKETVDEVLLDHPDWVTTVQNGSITPEKLSEQMQDYDDCYYDLPIKTGRVKNSDYYVVTIPRYIDGEYIELYQDITGGHPTPLEYAQLNHTTLTINGSTALQIKQADHHGDFIGGNYFSRGVLVRENFVDPGVELETNHAVYVSINQDRSTTEFDIYATAEELVEGGAYTTFIAYYPLIKNGQKFDLSDVTINEGASINDLFPFMVCGLTEDKRIKFIAVDGRTPQSYGLLATDVQDICLEEGLVNAWAMDGGGSASMVYKGAKLNRNHDGNGTQDRTISGKLCVKKERPLSNTAIADVVSQIGIEKQRIIQQIIPAVNKIGMAPNTQSNILEIAETMPYGTAMYRYSGGSADWLPTVEYVPALFIIHNAASGRGKVSYVTAIPLAGNSIAVNVYENQHWHGWNIIYANSPRIINEGGNLLEIARTLPLGTFFRRHSGEYAEWLPDNSFVYGLFKIHNAASSFGMVSYVEAINFNGTKRAVDVCNVDGQGDPHWSGWNVFSADP